MKRIVPAVVALALLLSPALAHPRFAAAPVDDREMKAAEQLFEAREYAAAAEKYRAIVRGDASNGLAWRRLGYCLHVEKRLDEALEAHLKSTEFPEHRALGWYNAGCVHALKGRADEAFEALGKAVDAGFVRAEQFENDPDLESIRGDARFAALLKRAGAGQEDRDSSRRNVAILVHRHVELLDFAGPAEVFANASRTGGGSAFRVYTVAPTKSAVETSQSVTVLPEFSIEDAPAPHILVIPGGATQVLLNDPKVMEWVGRVAPKTEVTMSVCTGAFVLAKAGLLDGLSATTHYSALSNLEREYPKVKVKRGERVIDNGRYVTTAGISAGIDGALHVVGRLLGESAAADVARGMEYERRRPGSSRAGEAGSEPNAGRATADAEKGAVERLYASAVRAAGDDKAKAIAMLRAALEGGTSATRLLTETAFEPLRCERAFRDLIRDHTRQAAAVLVTSSEAGTPLVVSGVVRTGAGRPVEGALIYAYHTDAGGYYSPGGMDEANPRLFGFVRTGTDGKYEIRTIRPGTYYNAPEIEQHIHFEVESPGGQKRSLRMGFSDEPRWGGSPPAWARPVNVDAEGVQRCTYDISLERDAR